MTRMAVSLGILGCAWWLSLGGLLLLGVAEPGHAGQEVAEHHHDPGEGDGHATMRERRPPSGMDPQEDLEYSRFMHHTAGKGLLVLGGLLLADRLTGHRHRLFRFGIGGTWVVLGLFLFIFSDLEAWPIGPAGFIESFSLPTAHEWIQHHLLSMIPMVLGVYAMLPGRPEIHSGWKYLAAALAAMGGAGLMIHQHLDHPGMDFVNFQHRIFALTSFFIAVSLVMEDSARISWKGKAYLLPAGLLLFGIELAFYVE